jgi:ferric-dicitrate binding protein FerR (iron transport regulator)
MKRKYEQYTAEDFLQDSFFLQWMQGQNQAVEFWEDWLENHPEKKEEVQKARYLFSELTFEENEIEDTEREQLWSKISAETIDSDRTLSHKIKPNWARVAAYAAMLAILVIAAIYFWPSSSMELQTQMAEIDKVRLPDRSTVVLNADTRLTYNETEKLRGLSLNGEAFFDVKEGKTFKVESEHGVVTVLGTSFNIYDRQNQYEVVCISGSVKVELKQNGLYTLTKGEYVRLNAMGELETNDDSGQLIESKAVLAWRQGEFFFENAQLIDVMEEVERQFDVEIHLDNELKDIQGAFYFTNNKLDEALQNILWPLHLTYSKDGRHIYIKK